MKEKVSVPFMLLGILFNVCLIAANLLETKVIQVGSLTVFGDSRKRALSFGAASL